ncbi:MAG: hypothetical protein U1E97_03375 [Alphaproteobacteria bacterium]
MTKRSTNARKDDKEKFGPLTKAEWVELDSWVFQEVPENVYGLFERVWQHFGVPMEDWLDKKPHRNG